MLTVDIEKLATYQIGMEKGIEKGIQEGIQEGFYLRSLEIAKNMLARGMAEGLIASVTGLSLAEVEGLREEGQETH